MTKAHKDRLVEKFSLSNNVWMGFSHRTAGIDPGKAYKSVSENVVGHNEAVYKLNKSSTGVNLTKSVNFLKGVTEETGTAVEG